MADHTLYDRHGMPIKTEPKALEKETDFTNVGRFSRSFDDSIASGLRPRNVPRILKAAADGDMFDFLTLAEEMEEREPHYASVLGTRKRAVSSIDMTVDAASDSDGDNTIAAAVKELVEQPDFIDMLDDALDGIGKGYAVIEMMWDTRSPVWMPRDFVWQDPRLFQFDRQKRRTLEIRQEGNKDGLPLTPAKFITHMPKLKSGKPVRAGLARVAVWSFVLKSYTLKDWAQFCEVFGMPLRVGKYHANASDEDKRKLMRAVLSIASDAAGIIPQGMDIEFIQNGARGGDSVFGHLAKFLDEQVSKIVLGQTMTADSGSSRAQAEVHNEVRLDVKAADARQLEASLNKDVIRPFVDVNFGRQERYPAVRLPVQEPEDLERLANVLAKLVPLGLRVSSAEVRDRAGFSDPDEDAEILGAPVQDTEGSDTDPAKNRRKASNSAQTANDLLDEIGADELSQWETQMDPLLQPVRDLVNGAGSLEEILTGLEDLTDKMDDSELARGINRARLKARGVGDVMD
jgi:phage gp29-like protein